MYRRILAALVVALAVLILLPARLGGEPTTSTTTDVFGMRAADPANPLALYRDRPNARYEDIEARPHGAVELGISRLDVVTWSVEPHDALPGLSVPARTAPYERLGLVDGYELTATSTTGDILHVVVRMAPTLFTGTITCVATAAADGTVLVPYDRPPPKPRHDTSSTSETTPVDIDLYLPLGAIRGRLYLTCRNSFFGAPIGDDRRAVWGIDV